MAGVIVQHPIPLLAGKTEAVYAGRVLIIANSNSLVSMDLAHCYRISHCLPSVNVLSLPFENPISLSESEFENKLLHPLNQRLQKLGNRVDFIVLTRDVPYRVNGISVPTAIMFNGVDNIKPLHGYFDREVAFESSIPFNYQQLHGTSMISAFNFQDAERMIRNSHCNYPSLATSGTIYFCDGAGPRGVRNKMIPLALSHVRNLGASAEHVQNTNLNNKSDVMMQITGATQLELTNNEYLAGSILDNMTSMGGFLLEKSSQISILTFIQHGVCGAYGTVAEPTNILSRWADLSLPLRYSSGFNLIESYLQSIMDWRFGLIVGDPLMAPFNSPCSLALNLAQTEYQDGNPVVCEIKARPGKFGRGIAWMELWLNDQDLLFDYQSKAPHNSQWQLVIGQGNTIYFNQVYHCREEQNLSRVLDYFTYFSTPEISLKLVGKRQNKLLVQYQPVKVNSTIKEVDCIFRGGTILRPMLIQKKILLHTNVVQNGKFDFGYYPPQAGDQVKIIYRDNELTVRAGGNESLAQFVTRLAETLEQWKPFNLESFWNLSINSGDGKEVETQQLWLKPSRNVINGHRPVIAITAVATPHSMFAKDINNKIQWIDINSGQRGEAIIESVGGQVELSETLTLPAKLITSGQNTLQLIAGSFLDKETKENTTFIYHSSPLNPQFTVHQHSLNVGDFMTIDWEATDDVMQQAYIEIYMNGVKLNSEKIKYTDSPFKMTYSSAVNTMMIPGKHQIWLEWTETPSSADQFSKRYPLYRTLPQLLNVRRPLLIDCRFSPHDIIANSNTPVIVTGPYIHQGLSFSINRQKLPVRRDPNWGMNWMISVSDLQPGSYHLEIQGDPETEEGGVFDDPLTVLRSF